MPLTPEEEKELATIEGRLAQPDTETTGLTLEEEAELAQIEGQIQRLDQPRSLEVAARGAAQGITLGFSDEITGAVESVMTEKSYQQARDESREANRAAKEANPALFTASEVTGGLVGGVAALATLPASAPTAAAIATGSGLGAIAGAGYSKSELGIETVKDAAGGAALALAGDFAFRGAGKALKSLFRRSTPVSKDVLSTISSEVSENTRFRSATLKDIYLGKYNTADDYLLSEKAADRAIDGIDEAVGLVKDLVKKEKRVLGQALNEAKDAVGDIKVSGAEEFLQFKEEVGVLSKRLGINKKAANFLNKEIIQPIEEGFFTKDGRLVDITNMGVTEAHELKQEVARTLFSKSEEGVLFRQSAEGNEAIRKFTNSLIDKFNNIDQTGTIKNINQKFSRLYDMDGIVPQSSDDVGNLLKGASTSKGAVKGRSLISTANGYDPAFAGKLYDVLNPRLKLFSAVRLASETGFGASEAFRIKAGAGLAGPVGGLAAVGKPGIALAGNIITASARKAFKIPRSISKILDNQDIIVSKISAVSPAMAAQAQKAFNDNDVEEINALVTQALNSPDFAKEFEEGIGFEGKAVTPEEHTLVEGQIKGQGLSIRQKREMLQNFRSTSIIPTEEDKPETGRFYSVYQAKKRVKGKKVSDY